MKSLTRALTVLLAVGGFAALQRAERFLVLRPARVDIRCRAAIAQAGAASRAREVPQMSPSVRGAAMLVIVGVAIAACGGAALSSAATATPASSTGATAAPLDGCLVGTWTVVAQNQSSPANDEEITYSGGTGEVFTIDAGGGVTIDTSAAKQVVFSDSTGQTFTATVAGTGHGTLSTLASGDTRFLFFTPGPDDTRTTHSFGPSGAELGPARPDTPFNAKYTCAPGRLTFYKTAVNYMIDGPIVELKSGSAPAPSTASPSPS